MSIRPACSEDIEAVVRLERRIAAAPHWGEPAYCEIVAGEGLARCLLVAEATAGLVGFAVGRIVGQVAELESVAVAETARRMGVGRALCGAVIAWAREKGAGGMELEVRTESVGARELYAGLGFVEEGRRRGYYQEPADDAVLMRLEWVAQQPEQSHAAIDAGL